MFWITHLRGARGVIPIADDVRLWREREHRTRIAASGTSDERRRDNLLAIADSYARMATMAERRIVRYQQRAEPTFIWNQTGAVAAGVVAALVLLILRYAPW